MKRIFILCLVCTLLFSSFASAEEFTLRNGIKFGDTMEEVKNKETLEIDKFVDKIDTSENDTSSDDETKYPYSITTKKGTLAGISDSYIYYQFDAEKTLRNVDYCFKSSSYKDFVDNDYDNVNQGLRRKYGSPLGYSGGSMYIFSGTAITFAALIAYLYDYIDGYGDLRDYDEWVVDADGYHVKIEQVEYYYGSSYSSLTYGYRMSYTYFTDDDLKNAQDSKREEHNSVDNDL